MWLPRITSKASARASLARFELVTTFIPELTLVRQARASFPSTSTRQVSQLSIGPMSGE
jgi:hypothetical protein